MVHISEIPTDSNCRELTAFSPIEYACFELHKHYQAQPFEMRFSFNEVFQDWFARLLHIEGYDFDTL